MLTQRNPEETRKSLIHSAFHEIYRNGFRGASLDRIIQESGVTKGALYHHFPTKMDLGYAVLDQIVHDWIFQRWIEPLKKSVNPIDALIAILDYSDVKKDAIECGCPLNNLAQEMSPLDEGFRNRINNIFSSWINAIGDALQKGQANGTVKKNIDPQKSATLIVSICEGAMSLAKNARSCEPLTHCKDGLKLFLDSLREEN